MKETEITRFLATEVLGWELSSDGLAWRNPQDKYRYTLGIKEFDPFNDIRHAFMVEDRILFAGDGIAEKYAKWLADLFVEDAEDWDGWFHTIHAAPKHRSIAAFKAVATDEQIAKMGLN